eukprot:PITA_34687
MENRRGGSSTTSYKEVMANKGKKVPDKGIDTVEEERRNMVEEIEDKEKVFEGGPYFYVAAGLFMRPWKMNFAPEWENFTSVPVWVRLYSLPLDYWRTDSLAAIGNKLGKFVKASKATRRGRYTSFARICVEMDLSRALPDEVILEVYDEEWVKAVDYEHILFKCHRCHEHGHLLRDCRLVK